MAPGSQNRGADRRSEGERVHRAEAHAIKEDERSQDITGPTLIDMTAATTNLGYCTDGTPLDHLASKVLHQAAFQLGNEIEVHRSIKFIAGARDGRVAGGQQTSAQ